MLLTIVLIVLCLLEAGAFAVYVLLNRRRNHRRNRIIADLADGTAVVDPIIPSDAAVRAVQGVLGRYSAMLDELEADLAESERASTRLSRNIQKSLIYAADISTHSEENHETARTLRHDVTEGSSAVEEIMATIDSLSKQVMEQLRAVETTTEAMAEIDSALQNVFSIASERLKDTDALIRVTQQGRAKIEETDGVIRNVTEKVEDVSNLITVINTIASKTNLLAMNAAIEAAHAGDAGRGFAVVAEEIRNLASSTSDNAKSISVTLKELVDQINDAAASSRSSGEAFGEIDTGVGNVTDSFREINRLTSEISDRSGAVVESARALKDISGRTAEIMEEMSIGSHEIGKILSSSLTIADELDSSMAHLTDKARGINLISTKISSSYLRANRVSEKLALTLERNRGDSGGMMQDRISISNLILAHINWIAMARAVMDGTVESADIDLVDSRKCDLGRWLEEAATVDIGDAAKLATLKSTHEELHECVGTLFQHVGEGGNQDAAKSYEKLLDLSARIVQILTTIGYDDFIKWDPSLTVGINTFDAHHQKLIGLINKLFVNMESGEGEDVLKRTLSELIDYTDWHFSAEEKAFEEFGYPERSDHVQQHQILLTKARELQNGLEAGQSILTNEVLDFLQDWVMNHILKTDRKYTSHLHGRVS